MRSNIDLTADRDFRKEVKSELSGILRESTVSFAGRRYPWSDLGSGYRSDYEKELVLTGDSKERVTKRRWLGYKSGTMCERCGLDNKNKPWVYIYGLCGICDDINDYDYWLRNDLVFGDIPGR